LNEIENLVGFCYFDSEWNEWGEIHRYDTEVDFSVDSLLRNGDWNEKWIFRIRSKWQAWCIKPHPSPLLLGEGTWRRFTRFSVFKRENDRSLLLIGGDLEEVKYQTNKKSSQTKK
jgi:hypothetical protein